MSNSFVTNLKLLKTSKLVEVQLLSHFVVVVFYTLLVYTKVHY